MSTELDWVDGSLDAHPALTLEGLARRDTMRDLLQGAVVTRRRRRTAYRWASRSAAAAAVILAALLVWPNGKVPENPTGLNNVVFETVRNDPTAVARFAIDDDELLALCREVGRPTGLIRVNDQLILTEDVVDEDL